MRNLIMALAAVFVLCSWVEEERLSNEYTIDDACLCTISYWDWHFNGANWVYGPVSSSAMVRDSQICDRWRRETGADKATFDTQICENPAALLNAR